jgi:hypothetical protein
MLATPSEPNRGEPRDMSAVKIFDAGGSLMLSGASSSEVEAALADHLKRGAKLVSPVTRVGRSWTAACSIPIQSHDLSATQTLRFAALREAARPAPPTPIAPVDDADGCKVEVVGFKRLISSPDRETLAKKVEHLQSCGATLVGSIERDDSGAWLALCDLAPSSPGQ